MKLKRYAAVALTATAILLTGCAQGGPPEQAHLDPSAPASHGLPARPAAGAPSPLSDKRALFGLFKDAPTSATISALSVGLVSPDGRYRAVMTAQGGWVARVDGAWLWQMEAPPLPPPPTPPGQQAPSGIVPGKPAPTGAVPPPPAIRQLDWMPNGALLLRDEAGRWLTANPEKAQVTLLPALFQGKWNIQFSPNGAQVLYSTMGRTGEEVWVAFADGTREKLLGVGMTGWWDEAGKPVLKKVEATPTGPGGKRIRATRFTQSPQ